MSDEQFPKEAEKTIYERDKTAKEPKVENKSSAETHKKPKIKPRKIFKPKKAKIKTDKPLEHRVRHIRLSSIEPAKLIRQTIVDYQKELAAEPSNDPDKEFIDYEKIEKFFGRLAKKYSTCPSRMVGGDLDWIHAKTPEKDDLLTEDLRDEIMKGQKFVVSEPVKTTLGIHLVLICETRICQTLVEEQNKLDPRYEALAAKDQPRNQAPPSSMDIPS